jgi:uncharacterized membrane protein|tara:strand:+ start:2727 stop:2927 length:201 start_codon:yes stop_codon:yes gene_type:complete
MAFPVIPVIVGLLSVGGTAGWMWWSSEQEAQAQADLNAGNIVAIVAILALILLMFFLFRIGKIVSS